MNAPKLAPVFHYISFILQTATLTYYSSEVVLPGDESYGGRYKHILYLNLILQFVYFNVAIMADLQTVLKKRKNTLFLKVRDILFTTLVLPGSIVLMLIYWGFFLPKLQTLNQEFSSVVFWQRHLLQTAPSLYAILESLVTPHAYLTRYASFLCIFCTSLVYQAWNLWIFVQTGLWAFPVFNTMTTAWILASCLGSVGLMCALCLSGEKINNIMWKNTSNLSTKQE